MFFHYISYACIRIISFRKLKFAAVNIISKGYYVYSFSVLRHSKILTIQNPVIHLISDLLKSSLNNLKSAPFVMNGESLYIFTKNNFGLPIFTNSNNILKQSSTTHTFIIIIKSHTLSCQRKCLTRKTR